jgi:DNA-binding XRE family transcriptional regulator
MLLRGIYGCFVYAVDDGLREYLKTCETHVKAAVSGLGDVADPVNTEGVNLEDRPLRSGTPFHTINHEPNPDKRFGNTIVRLRKEQGLSQEDLAFRAGIRRSYMGVIERGEKSPSIDTIAKVAKGLGMSIGDLFAGDTGDS